MEQSSQLVVFGAVALSLIVLLRRLRALEATLADRTAALDARSQPKVHSPQLLSLTSTYLAAPVPSLSSRTREAPAPAPSGTNVGPTGSGIDGETNLFETLPPETVERVFEALPATAKLQCERVCSVWRAAVCPTLWPEWRHRQARLTETPLSLPGVPAPSYASSPVDIPPLEAALAAEAHAAAAALPAEQLQLGMCGTGWTVLARTAKPWRGLPLTPLRQLSVADYLLCTSPCGLWVASGDKDGQVRLWCARTGALLRRFGFGGSVAAMALCRATGLSLLLGDSTGAPPLTRCLLPHTPQVWPDLGATPHSARFLYIRSPRLRARLPTPPPSPTLAQAPP